MEIPKLKFTSNKSKIVDAKLQSVSFHNHLAASGKEPAQTHGRSRSQAGSDSEFT